MDFEKYNKKESLYAVCEKLWGDWYIRNIFIDYKKAFDFIYQMKDWEKRWQELGFGHAPAPGIYKIVRFKEMETFTIEQ